MMHTTIKDSTIRTGGTPPWGTFHPPSSNDCGGRAQELTDGSGGRTSGQ